jgi:hypothetical protein
VARKTTTTTVVYSEKTSDGTWNEQSKTVTTVVERDDEGYPYGPVPYSVWTARPDFSGRYVNSFGDQIGNFFGVNDYLSERPAAPKPQQVDVTDSVKEDGHDGC